MTLNVSDTEVRIPHVLGFCQGLGRANMPSWVNEMSLEMVFAITYVLQVMPCNSNQAFCSAWILHPLSDKQTHT